MMDDIQRLAGQVSVMPSQDGIVRSYKPVRYDMGGFDESVHPEVQAMHREVQWFINDIVNKPLHFPVHGLHLRVNGLVKPAHIVPYRLVTADNPVLGRHHGNLPGQTLNIIHHSYLLPALASFRPDEP